MPVVLPRPLRASFQSVPVARRASHGSWREGQGRDGAARVSWGRGSRLRGCGAAQAARLEVERELAKARVELKRETEQQRLAAEQDRAHRERSEALRKRFKDLIDAVETVNGMHGELEVTHHYSLTLNDTAIEH